MGPGALLPIPAATTVDSKVYYAGSGLRPQSPEVSFSNMSRLQPMCQNQLMKRLSYALLLLARTCPLAACARAFNWYSKGGCNRQPAARPPLENRGLLLVRLPIAEFKHRPVLSVWVDGYRRSDDNNSASDRLFRGFAARPCFSVPPILPRSPAGCRLHPF